MIFHRFSTAAAALVFALLPQASIAQESSQANESQKAFDAAIKAADVGPKDVVLADQATLHLPVGMVFVPKSEANLLLVSWGNSNDDRLLGMVMPVGSDENWVTTIDQTSEGYVKDEEAKNWDADGLLQELKDGTEAQNEDRINRGFPPLQVTGWIERPNYDASSHRLVWSMKMIHKDVPNDPDPVVNYNTYALGRDGYLEVDLLTNEQEVERHKPFAKQVLAAIEYKEGKRYEDFNAGTDNVAAYGLAALVGGVAAKKLGLLALIGVFFAKFAKIILVGLAVAGGGLLKFFRRKSKDT